MPYPSNDKLPDAVKNALPSDAQNIWRNAFNSSYSKDGDEEKANKIAWGAVSNAGFEKGEDGKWVKKMADPKTHSFDAEIFSVGTWNGDKYTDQDLEDIVRNFGILKDEYKPPIKLGHNEKQMKDGNPALGWVVGLKKAGSKLIASFADVPDIVYRAIKSGRYKRISSEIYWNLKHGGKVFKRALAAVALLGADVPAVNNLADLEAYLTQSSGSSFDSVKLYSFDTDDDGKLKIKTDKRKKKMADELDIKDLLKKITKLETDFEATTEQVNTYKNLVTELQDGIKEKEKEVRDYKSKLEASEKAQAEKLETDRTEEMKVWAETMVKEFKMLPVCRDLLFKEDARLYTKEKGFSVPFETFKAYVEMQGKVIDPKEVAVNDKSDPKTYDNVGSKLDAMAREYAADKKCSYGEAITAVMSKHPELADDYIDEAPVDKDAK